MYSLDFIVFLLFELQKLFYTVRQLSFRSVSFLLVETKAWQPPRFNGPFPLSSSCAYISLLGLCDKKHIHG